MKQQFIVLLRWHLFYGVKMNHIFQSGRRCSDQCCCLFNDELKKESEHRINVFLTNQKFVR